MKYLNFHAKNPDFDRTILTIFARKSKLICEIFCNRSSKSWILDDKVSEIFEFSCQKSRFWPNNLQRKKIDKSILTSFARKSKLMFSNQSSKYWILDGKVGEIFQFSCQKSKIWPKYAKSKSKFWPNFKEFLQWKFKIFRQFEHFIKQN